MAVICRTLPAADRTSCEVGSRGVRRVKTLGAYLLPATRGYDCERIHKSDSHPRLFGFGMDLLEEETAWSH